MIDETIVTSVVHSIDNPLGSSSPSCVFNSNDQPDALPLCIKNFTTIDEASITPEVLCIDNTLWCQSGDTDSSLNISSSFEEQLKKYQ